jgi:hypothetical protein
MDRTNATKDNGSNEVRKLTTSHAEARRLLKQLASSNASFITLPAKRQRRLQNKGQV